MSVAIRARVPIAIGPDRGLGALLDLQTPPRGCGHDGYLSNTKFLLTELPMNSRRIAVAINPGLPCISAIPQPRTGFVDFPLVRRNLLRSKSLCVSEDQPCPTGVSPFGISPHQVLQFWTFSFFSAPIPISSSLFPKS